MGSRLQGVRIFVLASVPSREQSDRYQRVPDAHINIEEAVLSLARAVFSESGSLVLVGDATIAPLIAMVASEYKQPTDAEEDRPLRPAREDAPRFSGAPLIIFQSEAYRELLPDDSWLMRRLNYAAIHWVEAVNGERFHRALHGPQCLDSRNFLTRTMLQEIRPTSMVAIGGMEDEENAAEVFFSIPALANAQVFTLEGTGGVAARLRRDPRGGDRVHAIDQDLARQLADRPPLRESQRGDLAQRPGNSESGARQQTMPMLPERDRTWTRSQEPSAQIIAPPPVAYALTMQVLVDRIADQRRGTPGSDPSPDGPRQLPGRGRR